MQDLKPSKIAAKLDRRGYKTKNGKVWHTATVQSILANEIHGFK